MSRIKGAALARADLLRVLAAVGDNNRDNNAALVQGLGFFKAKAAQHFVGEQVMSSARASGGELLIPGTAMPTSTATPTPPRTPLRAPFFGITHLHLLEPTRTQQPQSVTQLTAADYLPLATGALPFHPLASNHRLASRMQAALLQQQASTMLDVARVLPQLARLRALTRWPRRTCAYPPARVCVLVDRSLAMRPYWDDQEQLVQVLAKWLGPNALATYTIPGDPWQPACAWLYGRMSGHTSEQTGAHTGAHADEHTGAHTGERPSAPARPPALLAPESGSVVLLLSTQRHSSRWQQAAQFLASKGARVLWHAPDTQTHDHDAGEILLTLLACACRIEPELVRAVRKLHPQTATKPQLEAQLWASPVLNAGYDVAVWQADKVAPYREKFARLPMQIQQQVLQTMRQVHAVRGQTIAVQETLAWAAHVAPATEARFAPEVWAATVWLQQLVAADQATRNQSGFAAFAEQIFTAHAHDANMLRRFEQPFAALWAIADCASQARGEASTALGALAAESVAAFVRLPDLDPPSRYFLRQRGAALVLTQDQRVEPCSPIGMPLVLSWLTLDNGRRQLIRTRNQAQVPLGRLVAGQTLTIETASMALTVAQVVPPFMAERGRDEYGLYAVWQVAGQPVRLRYIEPGQFTMGSNAAEQTTVLEKNESPQHQVTISQGYWLAETACTQALWQAVMGNNPSKFHENAGGGPQHPVEQVSWLDVQQFLSKLASILRAAGIENYQVSLPTEAEWEYACRAGTTTPFWFGENIQSDQVNYDGTHPYRNGKKGEYRAKTVAVEALPQNGWGLYQMHGNVWEWCADGFRVYADQSEMNPGLKQALKPDLTNDSGRAVRGGGWSSGALDARCACRGLYRPDGRDDGLGFRFALRSRHQ